MREVISVWGNQDGQDDDDRNNDHFIINCDPENGIDDGVVIAQTNIEMQIHAIQHQNSEYGSDASDLDNSWNIGINMGTEFTAVHRRHDSDQSQRSPSDSEHESTTNNSRTQTTPTINAISINRCCFRSSSLLTVSVLVAGATYSSLFNLKDNITSIGNTGLEKTCKAYRVGEIILHPDHLPDLFYSIMFMTVAFTLSIVGVGVPLWSIMMIKPRSFLFRALPLLGLTAFFLSYAFAMKEIVPKFHVKMSMEGSLWISSFWLVWLCGLPLTLALVAVWLLAMSIMCASNKCHQSSS